jgi:hypothetical protein
VQLLEIAIAWTARLIRTEPHCRLIDSYLRIIPSKLSTRSHASQQAVSHLTTKKFMALVRQTSCFPKGCWALEQKSHLASHSVLPTGTVSRRLHRRICS